MPAARGISCFLVEKEWGIRIAKHEDKLGMRGSPTGEVVLDEVRVPASHRIGEEGQGFTVAMHTLDRSRPTIGAQAVGIGQGAIDYAAAYMKQRHAFGGPIADLQGLRFMLADMATRNEAARALVYRACALVDDDPDGELTSFGAMAKAFASDAAMSITIDAVQLLGGYGYTKDFPVERFLRDAKVTQIYEGTNQVQKVVIARELLKQGLGPAGRRWRPATGPGQTSRGRPGGAGDKVRTGSKFAQRGQPAEGREWQQEECPSWRSR